MYRRQALPTSRAFRERFARHVAPSMLAVLYLVACGSPTGPVPTVTLNIRGSVESATTGTPIGGAAVKVWYCPGLLCLDSYTLRTAATTDTAGHYALVVREALPIDGRCIWAAALSVSANGFAQYYVPYTGKLPIRCVAAPQGLDFQLTPAP